MLHRIMFFRPQGFVSFSSAAKYLLSTSCRILKFLITDGQINKKKSNYTVLRSLNLSKINVVTDIQQAIKCQNQLFKTIKPPNVIINNFNLTKRVRHN